MSPKKPARAASTPTHAATTHAQTMTDRPTPPKRGMARRMFLRGAAGAALGIPFLGSLLPRSAQSQPTAVPMRYVQWVTNHGQYAEKFWPDGGATPSMPEVAPGVRGQSLRAFAGPLSPVLGAAFDPIRDHINVVRGLDVIHRANLHNSSAPTCGSANVGDNGNPCDGQHECVPFKYSVDGVLEQFAGLYPEPVRTPALRLTPGLSSGTKWGTFCWHGDRLPTYDSTSAAFDAVFAAATTDTTRDPNERRAAILDDVLEDYRRVRSGPRIGTADRQRLDDYMDLVAGVRSGLTIDTPACSTPTLDDLGHEPDFVQLHRNATDIACAALACGATRVVAYHCFHVSPTEQMSVTSHEWAHNRAYIDDHAGMQAFRYGFFARLVETLAAMSDADGNSVLHNTFAYCANELSSPDHGTGHLESLPIVTAGAGGGRFQTGQYLDFGGRPINNLLVSIFDAMGLAPTDYERGHAGFGSYDGDGTDRYAAHLGESARRRPLEVLTTG